MKSRLVFLASLAASSVWGGWSREQVPSQQGATPGLFGPVPAYHEMGLLAQQSPLAFVGGVRFFAGPTPDSTLAVFSLSLANSALTFRRVGPEFQARYQVEAGFRAGSPVGRIASAQTVRVATLSETRRVDESVIFQQAILLSPGEISVDVVVQDDNGGSSSRDEQPMRVPRFEGAGVSSIVPVYRSEGRAGLQAKPDLLVNPRASVSVGSDTLSLYLEAYGATSDSAVTLRAVDEGGTEVWRSIPEMRGDTAVRTALVHFAPGALTAGRLRIEAVMAGTADPVRTLVLVGYADQWMVANFEGLLSLLRYFGLTQPIQEMRTAPDAARAALWRAFWKKTDTDPGTPENEPLAQYFSRLQVANARYREGTQPGWLTDQGEVYATLGEPAEMFQERGGLEGQTPQVDLKTCRISCPTVGWRYTQRTLLLARPLTLMFVWDSQLGRYRMDPSSRREFQLRLSARGAEG